MTLRAIASFLLSIAVSTAHAQHYVPVEKGSKIEFNVKDNSKGTRIRGLLNKISGKITFDPKNLGRSSFDITVGTVGATTGDAARDNELRGPQYLSVLGYPAIRFVSTSVTQDRPGSIVYILQGNLTIKGVTRPAKIQFTATPTGRSYTFRGTLLLNRLSYNVGDKGSVDELVTVYMEVKTR